jgi:aldehyde dehydrogenase (NAD(P)+)
MNASAIDARSTLDEHIATLREHASAWASTSPAERIAILEEVKDALLAVSAEWATEAARNKQIPDGSSLVGEEWISGPYAVMAACNDLIATLSQLSGRAFLDRMPKRTTPSGQLAVQIAPLDVWDHLLLSGVSAEVWMQDGVTAANLAEHTASAYAVAPSDREGRVALVLGAGNIAAITPLDCFQKLFGEHQVVLLKMNPVNAYLTPFLERALDALIRRGALRIVQGDGAVGAYLCEHEGIDEIHITGAGSTHDRIVWGTGDEGAANRAAGTPRTTKRITSELGAVCPTIVVDGPWTQADLRFQAEQIATQKMHNSGFNCVACQVLIVAEGWDQTDALLAEVERVVAEMPERGLYYPGAEARLAAFAAGSDAVRTLTRRGGATWLISDHDPSSDADVGDEVFGPAMTVVRLPGSGSDFLGAAIAYANEQLHGTLGANVLIDPKTQAAIGDAAFDQHLADLRYGGIAVNAWTGLNFLMPRCTWGAFPGHTLEDVQSGIGVVHNTFLFDRPERTVVRAPFRPFPRTVAHGGLTLLPRPPWFVTNRRGEALGRLLTEFQHSPGWLKIPGVFLQALQG